MPPNNQRKTVKLPNNNGNQSFFGEISDESEVYDNLVQLLNAKQHQHLPFVCSSTT